MSDNKSLDGGIANQHTREYLQGLYMSHEAAAERAMNAHTKHAVYRDPWDSPSSKTDYFEIYAERIES